MPDAEQAQLSRQTLAVTLRPQRQEVDMVLEVQTMLLCSSMIRGGLPFRDNLWLRTILKASGGGAIWKSQRAEGSVEEKG